VKNINRILTFSCLVAIAITSCRNEPKTEDSNPFFSEYKTPFGVPPFDKIHASHYMPAFERGMNEKRRDLEVLLAVKEDPTFTNTIEAYDKIGVLLD
jgi:peptidyl-dipeptidase Dcp